MGLITLLRLLRKPGDAVHISLSEWDQCIRQARRANLLSSLRSVLHDCALLDTMPAAPRRHLEWAWVTSERHVEAVRWEVEWIAEALKELDIPLVLLKGAAYVHVALPPAKGRIFSDIDILVPKRRLPAVEAALMLNGWISTHHDTYDQRYYRDWMHELPPMRHLKRQTTIDVHHAILPETASTRPCPEKMLQNIVRVPDTNNLWTLSATDLVIHSAVHLFHEGEFDNSLRDLLDIHLLVTHFQTIQNFWDDVIARADELESARSLYYALRYSNMLLGTKVPEEVFQRIGQFGPKGLARKGMDYLFVHAIAGNFCLSNSKASFVARKLLYARANWLRMPPFLLARHLFHKAFVSPITKANA